MYGGLSGDDKITHGGSDAGFDGNCNTFCQKQKNSEGKNYTFGAADADDAETTGNTCCCKN